MQSSLAAVRAARFGLEQVRLEMSDLGGGELDVRSEGGIR